MNTNAKKIVKTGLTAVACLAFGLTAMAQNVQEGSVWAPAKIKVDGKLDEWDNTLQANNKTTNIYYTIANDEKNLYLAVKSADQASSAKILAGGINFTINTDGKKKDKDAFVVTFPLINRSGMRNQFRQRGGGGPGGAPGAPVQLDSAAIANMRAQALASIKEISIKGFKEIPDSVISIYNEYGIKAAVNYDKNGSLVYELALPFEQLGLSLTKTKEVAYNLKVNGIQMQRRENGEGGGGDGGNRGGGGGGNGGGGNGGGGGNFGGGGGGNFGGGGGGGGGRTVVFGGGGGGRGGFGGMGGMNMQDMMSPTDFWGKYVLAKK